MVFTRKFDKRSFSKLVNTDMVDARDGVNLIMESGGSNIPARDQKETVSEAVK